MSKQLSKLKILGFLSPEHYYKFEEALFLHSVKPNETVVLCGYSEFNISVGYHFAYIQDASGSVIYQGRIDLKAVSQEYALQYDEIPEGHKTICKLEFCDELKVPALLNLGILETWSQAKSYIWVMSA